MDSREIRQALETCEFFTGLDAEHLDRIAGLCRVKSFGPGQYVFRQGDFGEHVYVIAEGHICLERAVDMGARKGTAVIGMLGKGRVLGCWSTLLGEAHRLMSSAVCRKPTRLLALKGSDLRAMMREDTELGFRLLERLCLVLRDRIAGAYGAMEKI
jgi:CRP-like cAMP-binding protein